MTHLKGFFGSFLFHLAVLLFLLYWFSAAPEARTAPGERFAAGGIVLKAQLEQQNTEQQSETAAENKEETAKSLEKLSDIDLTEEHQEVTDSQITQDVIGSGRNSENESPANTEKQQAASLKLSSGDTAVNVFGTQGKGSKFFYVFDRSESMRGGRIQSAARELIQSLDSLGQFHQFNILFYSGKGELTLWRPGRKLIFATDTEKDSAKRFVSGVVPGGSTRHFEPLLEALRHRPDVIFFLTDGEREDDLTAAELNEIEKANTRGTQINVIQFGQGGLTELPSPALQTLAKQNLGQYQYIRIEY